MARGTPAKVVSGWNRRRHVATDEVPTRRNKYKSEIEHRADRQDRAETRNKAGSKTIHHYVQAL